MRVRLVKSGEVAYTLTYAITVFHLLSTRVILLEHVFCQNREWCLRDNFLFRSRHISGGRKALSLQMEESKRDVSQEVYIQRHVTVRC